MRRMTRKNLSETTQTRASSLFQLVGDDARAARAPRMYNRRSAIGERVGEGDWNPSVVRGVRDRDP